MLAVLAGSWDCVWAMLSMWRRREAWLASRLRLSGNPVSALMAATALRASVEEPSFAMRMNVESAMELEATFFLFFEEILRGVSDPESV